MDIIKRLSAVMEAVGNVSKSERNSQQGFNFRGIDAVVNAVSPALRREGVVVIPTLLSSDYGTVTIGSKQTQMGHARVTVEYRFYAPDGSSVSATVCAESMDSGDKATAKAMSVAFRTALLQALCLPTDETDPDHDIYERSPKQTKTPAPTVTKRQAPQESAPADDTPTPAPRAGASKPLSKAHQTWLTNTAKDLYPEMPVVTVVAGILKREIASLDEVTPEEAQTLIKTLASMTKGGN